MIKEKIEKLKSNIRYYILKKKVRNEINRKNKIYNKRIEKIRKKYNRKKKLIKIKWKIIRKKYILPIEFLKWKIIDLIRYIKDTDEIPHLYGIYGFCGLPLHGKTMA